jgi:hypothetical protein
MCMWLPTVKRTHKAADVVDPGAQRLVGCCLLLVLCGDGSSGWVQVDRILPSANEAKKSVKTCR